jgi:RNA polymerase sigma-70 factor (ECF subfamily)
MLQICLSALVDPADESRFEKIYYEYREMVYAISLSILNDDEDAKDATQESFLKIAKNFSCISENAPNQTRSFIVILSKNTAKDFYRKNQRERKRVVPSEQIDCGNSELTLTTDVLSEVISNEGYQKVVSIFEEMSDTYKDTLKLKFIHGWSNSEIAEHLEISRSAVGFRISHGRKLLISAFEKEGYHVGKQQKPE